VLLFSSRLRSPCDLLSFPTRRSSDLLRLSRGAAALATAAVLPAVCGTAPPPATAAGGRVTALVGGRVMPSPEVAVIPDGVVLIRSEEHTSELQSRGHLVCRLLLEKKK